MRLILFKGKDKDDKRWYEGGYVKMSDTTYCFAEDYEHARLEGKDPEHHYIVFDQITDWGLPNKHMQAEVVPETLCQFTGMYDKNCKGIYEQDIIRIINSLRPDEGELYLVAFRDGAFVATQGDMFTHLGEFNEKCSMEVIGNAIDDKELLAQIPCFTSEGFLEKLEKEIKGNA